MIAILNIASLFCSKPNSIKYSHLLIYIRPYAWDLGQLNQYLQIN